MLGLELLSLHNEMELECGERGKRYFMNGFVS